MVIGRGGDFEGVELLGVEVLGKRIVRGGGGVNVIVGIRGVDG